jgi:hypothetical protein
MIPSTQSIAVSGLGDGVYVNATLTSDTNTGQLLVNNTNASLT